MYKIYEGASLLCNNADLFSLQMNLEILSKSFNKCVLDTFPFHGFPTEIVSQRALYF